MQGVHWPLGSCDTQKTRKKWISVNFTGKCGGRMTLSCLLTMDRRQSKSGPTTVGPVCFPKSAQIKKPLGDGTELQRSRWRSSAQPWQGTPGRWKGRPSPTSGHAWESSSSGVMLLSSATGCRLCPKLPLMALSEPWFSLYFCCTLNCTVPDPYIQVCITKYIDNQPKLLFMVLWTEPPQTRSKLLVYE